jgi:hypothetical protein
MPQFEGAMAVQTARAAGDHKGVNSRFHAIFKVEFPENIFQMPLDRGRAYTQICGNFFVGLCARYQV